MRITRGYKSDQVEDRRGQRMGLGGGGGFGGGGIGLLGMLFKRFGIVGVLVGGAALYFMGAFSACQWRAGSRAAGGRAADGRAGVVRVR